MANFRIHDLIRMLIASISYIVLVEVSIRLILPLQETWIAELQNHTLLLFLPHGVRVLSAWLYGAKSIIYLLPGHLIGHGAMWSTSGLLDWSVLTAIAGACVGYFGFAAASYLLANLKKISLGRKWVEVLLAGSIASILNSAVNSLVYGTAWINAAGYLVGDISGLVALMLLLVHVFRIERRASQK